jgi:hypothetical protein
VRDRPAGRPKARPRGHPDDVLLASEATTLGFWRSTGAAIELLDRDDDGFTRLLERARPGTPLLPSGLSWDEMLVELGRLAREPRARHASWQRDDRRGDGFARFRELLRHRRGTAHRERRRAR